MGRERKVKPRMLPRECARRTGAEGSREEWRCSGQFPPGTPPPDVGQHFACVSGATSRPQTSGLGSLVVPSFRGVVMHLRLLAVLLVAAPASVGRAHDYWLQPATFTPAVGQRIALTLHVGDHFASEGERGYQKKPTLSFRLHCAGGTIDLAASAREGDRPVARFACPRAGTCVAALERDAHLITLGAAKFNRYLKEEGLAAVLAERKKRGEADRPGRERYRRYLKCLLRAGGTGDDTWKKPAGHKLEIVPLTDPTGLKAGQALKLRIVFDGKPLAGATVTAYSRVGKAVRTRSALTSAAGEASFTLDSGPCLVRLVHMRRATGDREADWHSFWAALTFAVP